MSKADDTKTGVPDEQGFAILFFVVGLVASLIFGWIIFPKLLYSEKAQPFDFNHQLHNELVGNGCESCHFFREDGSYAGTPTLDQCIECHADPMDVDDDERTFHYDYVAPNREVDWKIYSRQPDCVFFSHAAHVKMGEMDCATCHGDIGTSTSLKPYQENRITGYSRDIWGYNIAGFKKNTWDRMKMDDCAECHIENDVAQDSVQTGKGGCFKCHQ
jgi:hypothetical protein